LGDRVDRLRTRSGFQRFVADTELQNVFIRPFASDFIHLTTLVFRASIKASCVAIPIATPSYSARSHIRAVPRPQEPLFLGAVVFLLGNGLASLGWRVVCARGRVGKFDQHQAGRTDAGSHNSKEISPFHPIGSPSGRTALCIPIFASISQDACELAHIATRISQRDCARLPRIEGQNNVENRAT